MDQDILNLHDDGLPRLVRLSQIRSVTPPPEDNSLWTVTFNNGDREKLTIDLANKITSAFGWEIPPS
jgi:hypothetical protein